mgnify:CR=1 FL=1
MSEANKIEEENTKKLPVKKRYIFTSLAIIGALAAGYFIYDALGYQSTDMLKQQQFQYRRRFQDRLLKFL